jgi:predicted transcriptional regulator
VTEEAFTVDTILQGNAKADAERRANEARSEIADKLERAARDIRNFVYSPESVIVLAIEYKSPQLIKCGPLTWEHLETAREALQDASWRHAYKDGEDANDRIADGYERRQSYKRDQENERLAHEVAYAYKCAECHKGFKTTRGRNQHYAWERKVACVGCGQWRCSSKGGAYVYSDDYKGLFTCRGCMEKAPSEEGRKP